jgi:hypothetical protein
MLAEFSVRQGRNFISIGKLQPEQLCYIAGMVEKSIQQQRNIAATLVTIIGCSHIAELWFTELSRETLLLALLGAVYLFIGIGLFGRSRFTLFLAMALPAAGIALALQLDPIESMSALVLLRITTSLMVIALSTNVLWSVRNNPSV